jgi:serine protease AprX
MKLINSVLFVSVIGIAAVVAATLDSGKLHVAQITPVTMTNNQEAIAPKSYILQGSTSEHLNKVVSSVGGNVSREFPIINAVSALLTLDQVKQIKKLGNVRVQDDRTVITSGKHKHRGKNGERVNNHIAEQINATRLHDMGIKGAGVTVVTVDSGANMNGSIGRSLFENSSGNKRVLVKYNAFKEKEYYKKRDDKNGHGSHVAGIVSSSIEDDSGNYNGIAPDVNLISIKAFNANGQSSYSKVLDSLNWIFENRHTYKIRVVNLSLGAKPQTHYWDDPINQAVMRLWDSGIVVVSSAGNAGTDMGITVPGNTPYIITVGAVTDNGTPYDMNDDRVTTFSSKGPTYEGFIKPEVVAYGAQIAQRLKSKNFKRAFKLLPNYPDYSVVSGTSQAAAIVSGVAALVISQHPHISPDNLKCKIMASARTAVDAEAEGLSYSPFEQGSGLVDAYEAVMSTQTACANRGLDIKADLRGTQHFIGPAKVDAEGEYYLELEDGTIYSNGIHWGRPSFDLEGIHWGGRRNSKANTEFSVQGIHWGRKLFDLEGIHWAREGMSTNSANWNQESMDLKGIHWGRGAIVSEDIDVTLKSVHTKTSDSDGYLNEASEPIDPFADLPVTREVWE